MVNGAGQRFVNEFAPYIDVVHSMYSQHSEETPHIPAYFIFDQRYRNKYIFGLFFPMLPIPRRYFSMVTFVDPPHITSIGSSDRC